MPGLQHQFVVLRHEIDQFEHGGQQMAILRMLNRDIHSNYGPTADTGEQVVYAYPDIETLLAKLES